MEKHESEGTNKLFALAGILLDTLRTGKILLIDELDARLHPLITRELICLFNSNETNPHNAQLIFTTHDTNLLSSKTFRKDQIWFTEKDNKGATDLYSLVEYKVGKNASFERDYMIGKYGAIPFIGNFKELIGKLHEEKKIFYKKQS
jgi:AAA15 family ATPase/GTPase